MIFLTSLLIYYEYFLKYLQILWNLLNSKHCSNPQNTDFFQTILFSLEKKEHCRIATQFLIDFRINGINNFYFKYLFFKMRHVYSAFIWFYMLSICFLEIGIYRNYRLEHENLILDLLSGHIAKLFYSSLIKYTGFCLISLILIRMSEMVFYLYFIDEFVM